MYKLPLLVLMDRLRIFPDSLPEGPVCDDSDDDLQYTEDVPLREALTPTKVLSKQGSVDLTTLRTVAKVLVVSH